MKTKNKHEIPIIGERTRKLWNFSAIIWICVFYIVNILAFGASMAIVFIERFVEDNAFWIILLSIMSTLLSFIGVLINYRQQFTRYRRAFNILNFAMLDYYANPNNPEKIDAIVKAISEGEDIIDGSYDVETTKRRNNNAYRKEIDGLSVY